MATTIKRYRNNNGNKHWVKKSQVVRSNGNKHWRPKSAPKKVNRWHVDVEDEDKSTKKCIPDSLKFSSSSLQIKQRSKSNPLIDININKKHRQSYCIIYQCLLQNDFVQNNLETPELSKVIAAFAATKQLKCIGRKKYGCNKKFNGKYDEEGKIVNTTRYSVIKGTEFIICCRKCESHFKCILCGEIAVPRSTDDCGNRLCFKCFTSILSPKSV